MSEELILPAEPITVYYHKKVGYVPPKATMWMAVNSVIEAGDDFQAEIQVAVINLCYF